MIDKALLLFDVQQAFNDPKWGPRNNPTAEEKILKKMKEFEVILCSIAPALGVHHPIIPRLR